MLCELRVQELPLGDRLKRLSHGAGPSRRKRRHMGLGENEKMSSVEMKVTWSCQSPLLSRCALTNKFVYFVPPSSVLLCRPFIIYIHYIYINCRPLHGRECQPQHDKGNQTPAASGGGLVPMS